MSKHILKIEDAKVSELLCRAAELYAKSPCQGAYARNANGRAVDALSDNACVWDPEGSLFVTAGGKRNLNNMNLRAFWRAADILILAAYSLYDQHVCTVSIDKMPDVWTEAIVAAEAIEAIEATNEEDSDWPNLGKTHHVFPWYGFREQEPGDVRNLPALLSSARAERGL